MPASLSSVEFGKRLRAERERLCLSLRAVQKLSSNIAERRKNPEYFIARSSLADIENGQLLPNIHKLYSLSVIYGRRYEQLATFFGVPAEQAETDHDSLPLPRTYLSAAIAESAVQWTAALREKLRSEPTNLVAQMFKTLKEVPAALSERLDLRNSVYGYVGMKDYMLDPFIRPGSFVLIDQHQKRILSTPWHNDFDRPIFFIELRDCYVCCWCELHDGQLILIPTPQSRKQARYVRYPGEATIVGRVTAVTMPIAGAGDQINYTRGD